LKLVRQVQLVQLDQPVQMVPQVQPAPLDQMAQQAHLVRQG